tara:strand:- start:329 stop:544 length:216 start_codon:yes stop_codon:yes gene_type:complete
MGIGAGLGLGMILPQSMMSSFSGQDINFQNNKNTESDSIEEKLKTLKSLLDQELLTQEEYQDKRKKLLESL